jgi:excisionase family DNA binding protein
VEELTLKEAAELLGVTRHRVHGMIRQEQLRAEARRTPVGTAYLVVSRADVERLAEERRGIAEGTAEKHRPGPKPRVPKPAGGASVTIAEGGK